MKNNKQLLKKLNMYIPANKDLKHINHSISSFLFNKILIKNCLYTKVKNNKIFYSNNKKSFSNVKLIDLSCEDNYYNIANDFLESLSILLEEDKYKIDNIDYSSGVLSFSLKNNTYNYVINLQRPNRQIWLSSPISGPQRYEYAENIDNKKKQWVNTRDNNIQLDELLFKEISIINNIQ